MNIFSLFNRLRSEDQEFILVDRDGDDDGPCFSLHIRKRPYIKRIAQKNTNIGYFFVFFFIFLKIGHRSR